MDQSITSQTLDITSDLYKEMRLSSIQSGGFIGTLCVSLAGSLLPSLLGGNGLKRAVTKLAPSKPPKMGNGLCRAGTKPAPPKGTNKKSLPKKRETFPIAPSLTKHDINEYFGKTVRYPRDTLQKLDSNVYVINSDESLGKGKHWIASYNGGTECCIWTRLE